VSKKSIDQEMSNLRRDYYEKTKIPSPGDPYRQKNYPIKKRIIRRISM
jgi:dipeptidase